MTRLPQPMAVGQSEWPEGHDGPSLISLANAPSSPSTLVAMTKGEEQSLVMSLSFSWLLRVLVISAVLQQGMTAMRTQTPGCPVSALYHPDDRKKELGSSFCISGSGFYFGLCHRQQARCCNEGEHWKKYKTKNSLKVLMQEYKWRVTATALMENTRTRRAALGVWLWVSGGANGKASSPTACVCQFMFSVEWQPTNSSNMVLILLLAPLQPVILWFENTRDMGWTQTHAELYSTRHTHTQTRMNGVYAWLLTTFRFLFLIPIFESVSFWSCHCMWH